MASFLRAAPARKVHVLCLCHSLSLSHSGPSTHDLNCIYGNADMCHSHFCPIPPLCQIGTHRILPATPVCEVTRVSHKLHHSGPHPEGNAHTQVGPGRSGLHHRTPAQQVRAVPAAQDPPSPPSSPVTRCHMLSHANTVTPLLHSSHLSPALLVGLAGLGEGCVEQQEKGWPCLHGG